MTTAELVVAIIAFVLAGVFVLTSACQFAEKGFLFNNAYIWASKEEREKMDKTPHYRQSAIVFALLSAVFLVIGMSLVLQKEIIQFLEIPLVIGALIYAVVSSKRIERRTKK
ncbi:MAG: DUF3784 domain-containing protein [Oscillospiraceae bacterium]|nr:DUF3784 domain-containing protein [Oscillospiraceae bacterium]